MNRVQIFSQFCTYPALVTCDLMTPEVPSTTAGPSTPVGNVTDAPPVTNGTDAPPIVNGTDGKEYTVF